MRRPTRIGATFAAAVVFAACATSVRDDRTPAAAAAGGGTLQVAMTEPAYHGFDPQASYSQPQFELLRCCLVRTLMTYRGVPNFEGTQPVPDLATGPPSVSTDGKTWTFHLRPGIHYAPPLQDVTVTSGDIVRALLRAGSGQVNGGPGIAYLGSIEGFDEYVDGRAATIAGVSTPDDLTLQVHQIRSDRSIEHLFAMAFTSPIPPLPNDPDAALGVATGHPFSSTFEGGPPKAEGYGPFLVSTGPYMIEGSESLDLTAPPGEQTPTSGFAPGWWFDDPGSIALVRNPSWDPATDPNRPALPDRIEIAISPAENPYPLLEDGEIDLVMSENPPPPLLRRYQKAAELQDHIATTAGSATDFLAMNVSQPPFDDVHVRRAVALAIDRASMVPPDKSITSHLIPDPMIGGLLTAWSPFPTTPDTGDVAEAHTEMDRSRYGDSGRCAGPYCHAVIRPPDQGADLAIAALKRALASLGMTWEFRDSACFDPREHIGICDTGWFADFPDAGNMIVPFLSTEDGFDPSHLGASREQLRQWGYTKVKSVPSIQVDYERCATLAGVEAAMCWARIDQLLTGELVAAVPISSAEVIRLRSGGISGFAIDQAFGEPALDRISVDG
jgi:peptide/nickel transport system substrate-binding protein